MTPLSPKALAIVERTRQAYMPAPGARRRIKDSIASRLAAGAPGPTGGGIQPFLRANIWRFALGVSVASGSALVGSSASAPASTPMTMRVALPAVSIANLRPPARALQATSPVEGADEPRVEISPPVPRVRSNLNEEVGLLSRATSALRAGRPEEALTSLAEHQRKFPNGLLAVERRTARAQALCSLQRVSEGRAELARLSPQSPAAAHARRVCDAAFAKNARTSKAGP